MLIVLDANVLSEPLGANPGRRWPPGLNQSPANICAPPL
jgi:hypothetical protein